MHGTGRWIAAVVLLTAVGLVGAWMLGDDAPAAPERGEAGRIEGGAAEELEQSPRASRRADPGAGAADAVEVVVDEQRGALVRADGLGRAGSRTPRSIRPAADGGGLRCPDGRFLPLLNGVEAAPTLLRAPEQGPLPPVVAVLVDADGWDWYEHADGSITTTRPQYVTDGQGRRTIQVVTVHNAPGSGDHGPAEIPSDVGPTRR